MAWGKPKPYFIIEKECIIIKTIKEEFEKRYPLCLKFNKEMYNDVFEYYLIMSTVSDKMKIPVEELISFFSKGGNKLGELSKQEEAYKENEHKGNEILQEMQQDD